MDDHGVGNVFTNRNDINIIFNPAAKSPQSRSPETNKLLLFLLYCCAMNHIK